MNTPHRTTLGYALLLSVYFANKRGDTTHLATELRRWLNHNVPDQCGHAVGWRKIGGTWYVRGLGGDLVPGQQIAVPTSGEIQHYTIRSYGDRIHDAKLGSGEHYCLVMRGDDWKSKTKPAKDHGAICELLREPFSDELLAWLRDEKEGRNEPVVVFAEFGEGPDPVIEDKLGHLAAQPIWSTVPVAEAREMLQARRVELLAKHDDWNNAPEFEPSDWLAVAQWADNADRQQRIIMDELRAMERRFRVATDRRNELTAGEVIAALYGTEPSHAARAVVS